ncbi:hypothetical protein ACE2AJ_16845 [Aquihabitans daechungensis]|uniref:hypothetical protein n=1 Tax=Aquihabitans daechungensis TaxID=1052257 RepID=UPI003BA0A1CB
MSAEEALRATLFGDVAMDGWPVGDAPSGEPWDGFVRARNHLAAGDQDLAIREWAALETQAGFGPVESRHLLQAWSFLRSVGVQPDGSIAGIVLGVVVEVTVADGHDVLAAYADGSVRYLNHAGGSTVIDAAPAAVAQAASAVLAAGQDLAGRIGPWTEPHLPDLPVGHTRLTMLTRGGPRFGQGPADVFGADPAAAPILEAATGLLVAVVDL